MWWRKPSLQWRRAGLLARVAVILAAAGLTAGCWAPLYGRPTPDSESVHDKLAEILVVPAAVPRGTPVERIAVGMHNALQFDLSGGAPPPQVPTYRLTMNLSQSALTAVINPSSGRPDAAAGGVNVGYQLVEIASGKLVVNDHTFVHVDYDIPGSEQRFASQRALRDAENRAVQVAADLIRTRLASFFVAGT
jgi:LPS-assembly lipoprotein